MRGNSSAPDKNYILFLLQVQNVHKQKSEYAREITDNAAEISVELNKFTTGEKQLGDNAETIYWLLNVLNPLLLNCKINTVY